MTGRYHWLRERQALITGTDIPRILGVYFDGDQGAANCYAEKSAPQPVESLPSLQMELGSALEPAIADQFTRHTGIRLAAPSPYTITRHKDEPWIAATLDRTTAAGGAYCECKAIFHGADEDWGESGSDQVPDRVMLQCQWQGLAGGFAYGYVAALFVPHSFRWYRIETDPDLCATLVAIASAFRQRVIERAGVADWTHPLIDEALGRACRVDPNRVVVLDGEAQMHADSYFNEAMPQLRQAQKWTDDLKAYLLQLMGEAEFGLLPDKTRLKRSRTRNQLTRLRPRKR